MLYGGAAAAPCGRAPRAQQGLTDEAYRRSERANLDLQERLAELMTLNELAAAAGSTLDRDELLDRSLEAVTRHLRFDRALILLADEERGVLGRAARSAAAPRWRAQVAELELPLDARVSQLVQLFHSDGPLLFRDADHDPDERNRAFARDARGQLVPGHAARVQGPRRSASSRSTTGSPAATSGRATGRCSTRSAA